MLPNWIIILLLTVNVRMRERGMGKPVDLGANSSYPWRCLFHISRQTTGDVACSFMLFIHCVKQQCANELEYKTSDTARCSSAVQHSTTQGSDSPYGALYPGSVYTPLDNWEHSQLILKYTAWVWLGIASVTYTTLDVKASLFEVNSNKNYICTRA